MTWEVGAYYVVAYSDYTHRSRRQFTEGTILLLKEIQEAERIPEWDAAHPTEDAPDYLFCNKLLCDMLDQETHKVTTVLVWDRDLFLLHKVTDEMTLLAIAATGF